MAAAEFADGNFAAAPVRKGIIDRQHFTGCFVPISQQRTACGKGSAGKPDVHTPVDPKAVSGTGVIPSGHKEGAGRGVHHRFSAAFLLYCAAGQGQGAAIYPEAVCAVIGEHYPVRHLHLYVHTGSDGKRLACGHALQEIDRAGLAA